MGIIIINMTIFEPNLVRQDCKLYGSGFDSHSMQLLFLCLVTQSAAISSTIRHRMLGNVLLLDLLCLIKNIYLIFFIFSKGQIQKLKSHKYLNAETGFETFLVSESARLLFIQHIE